MCIRDSTWKIGRKTVGDGLLLVVALQDRKVRIEVAKTLEGAIPDLAAKRVIDQAITPRFKQGDYAVSYTHLDVYKRQTIERVNVTRKQYMPQNNTYYLYLSSPVKLSIEVSIDDYRQVGEGDELSIEYATHSKFYLGYF